MKIAQTVSISTDELQKILNRHFQNYDGPVVSGQLVKMTPRYVSQRFLPNLDNNGPDILLESDDEYAPGEYMTEHLSGFDLSFE